MGRGASESETYAVDPAAVGNTKGSVKPKQGFVLSVTGAPDLHVTEIRCEYGGVEFCV